MLYHRSLALIATLMLLSACSARPVASSTPEPAVLAPRATPNLATSPALAARATAVAESLHQPIPILRLPNLDADATKAQDSALADPQIQAQLRTDTHAPLRNEVFGVRPTGVGDVPSGVVCTRCYRIDIYHYATNSATIILVDLATGRAVAAQNLPNSQPDIPKALADLAAQIAVAAPEVQQALDVAPGAAQALMPQMKTALNQTRCERAQHLCVAPTFRKDDRLLWAVVDLTDLRLVGVQWSELGPSGPPITAKTIENAAISNQFCDRDTTVSRNGWTMRYRLTGSDGLEIRDVTFNGQPVLQSVKLVDWHVSYSGEKQFGYSDATGCPVFSSAAVPSYEPPEVKEIQQGATVVGFAVVQEFKHSTWPAPCSYFYEQRTEFYTDGAIRPLAISHGRGCGTEGTYRPVIRLALAGEGWHAATWNAGAWSPLATEAWFAQSQASIAPDGGWVQVTQRDGRGYTLAAGPSKLPDERNDNAYLYVTRTKANEGDTDLPTIGACCNADEHQGPDAFTNTEALGGAPLTLWYVPQMANDATPGSEYCWADSVVDKGVYVPRVWPCQAGPRLTPVRGAAS